MRQKRREREVSVLSSLSLSWFWAIPVLTSSMHALSSLVRLSVFVWGVDCLICVPSTTSLWFWEWPVRISERDVVNRTKKTGPRTSCAKLNLGRLLSWLLGHCLQGSYFVWWDHKFVRGQWVSIWPLCLPLITLFVRGQWASIWHLVSSLSDAVCSWTVSSHLTFGLFPFWRLFVLDYVTPCCWRVINIYFTYCLPLLYVYVSLCVGPFSPWFPFFSFFIVWPVHFVVAAVAGGGDGGEKGVGVITRCLTPSVPKMVPTKEQISLHAFIAKEGEMV